MDIIADALGGAKPENGRERPPEPAPCHYYPSWDPRSQLAAGEITSGSLLRVCPEPMNLARHLFCDSSSGKGIFSVGDVDLRGHRPGTGGERLTPGPRNQMPVAARPGIASQIYKQISVYK